ncbi:hypothetical protein ILUMI_26236, partial [Ignelater luminosus]
MEIKENKNLEKDVVNMSFPDPFALTPTKTPSKILGPLLVYTNKEPENNNTLIKEIPEIQLLPNISTEENHYYTSKGDSKKHSFYGLNPKKPEQNNKEVDIPYLGPLLPTYPPTANKQTKPGNKIKPNKVANTHFIPPNDEQPQYPFMPPMNQPVMPSKQPEIINSNPHIEIHGKGDPDEFLQFINQHPELSNYPSGSIFEIHNIPPTHEQKPGIPQHINPNSLLTQTNNRPAIPFVIQQHPQEDLPQNINVEHILQHIQKNSFVPFPNAHMPPNNGQLLITAPNGLVIPTRPQPNFTRP